MSGRDAQSGQQHLHLLVLSPRGEQRSSRVNLKDKAAETPDIYLVVVGLHQDDFRGTVVSALDVGEFLVAGKAG